MALLQDAAEAVAEPRGDSGMPDANSHPTSSGTPARAAAAEVAAASSAPAGATAGEGGGAPAAERLQKRVALPQHALLAAQLQVCPCASMA